jgi:hypothetical protein
MLPILLLALSRCASPAACPSDAELMAAIRQRNFEDATAGSDDQEYIQAPPRVSGIEDVRCDEFVAFEEGFVTCTWIVRYRRSKDRQIGRLTREGNGWRIEERMSVRLTSRR